MFLRTLAGSEGWRRIYIISPWLSVFDTPASLTFDTFLRRLKDDKTTLYVVTRPPTEDWHEEAIDLLATTGRANIALVPDLHAKLFTAHTKEGAFALLGSANFTQQSLANREIGLLVDSHSDGRPVFDELNREAAEIYRSENRRLVHKASFSF